jgi:phosphotransferase system HPr (HPr) family protein
MSTRAEIVVRNRSGLHARPAAKFVEVAQEFESDLAIHRAGRSANGKSLLSVLKLGVSRDTEIVIEADGPDEEQATEALTKLLAELAEAE